MNKKQTIERLDQLKEWLRDWPPEHFNMASAFYDHEGSTTQVSFVGLRALMTVYEDKEERELALKRYYRFLLDDVRKATGVKNIYGEFVEWTGLPQELSDKLLHPPNWSEGNQKMYYSEEGSKEERNRKRVTAALNQIDDIIEMVTEYPEEEPVVSEESLEELAKKLRGAR